VGLLAGDDGLVRQVAARDRAEVPLGERGRRREIEGRRGHAAAAVLAHQLPAGADQPERVLERERPRRDERAVLAQAVAGRERGLEPLADEALQRFEARDLVRQQRRLREAGLPELAARIAKRQLLDVVAEHVARLLVAAARRRELVDQVRSHARVLRALAGEQQQQRAL